MFNVCRSVIVDVMMELSPWEKLYSPRGGPRQLSIIPLKDSHLFKIAKSIVNFYFKFFYESAILNM